MKKSKSKEKRKSPSPILTILIFAVGLGVMLYPFYSNWFNQWLQDQLMEEYDHSVAVTSPEMLEAEKKACIQYNEGLLGNVVLTDPFDEEAMKQSSEAYQERLNLTGEGVMGYLEIPKINIKLVIYHGTTGEVLDKGVGHLENTSLPVGGEGTHAVLSAHTAYAKATLFNDLIDLEEGDLFYLKVLDETLAYQVDQIKVVEPTETEDLTINREEDYVTLVTCTPYGVNSHRLLVRGTRIPYEEETDVTPEEAGIPYLYIALAFILLLVILIIIIIIKRRRRRRKEVNYENET
ncbi:MAG: class C sortase [Lachnospiraceae bacterium]